MHKFTPGTRNILIFVFLILYTAPGIKVFQKAREDRTAFLRWTFHSERITEKKTIYGDKGHRYPNLPCMILILMPFHAMGSVTGSLAWMTFKFLIIVFIFTVTLKMVQNNSPPLPDWAVILVLILSIRVFASDLTHGNVNLVIGGLVVLSLYCSYCSKDFLSGLAIGLAAVLKVTPALFLPYFIYKKKWVSVAGTLAGIFLFAWFIPGLILGFSFNHQLMVEWYRQMILPFVNSMPVGYMQTQYMNQSFTGLFFRLFSDSTAIAAETGDAFNDLKINFMSLDLHTVSLMVKGASLGIVGCLALFCRTPGTRPEHQGNIGEYAIVFLAMLLLSERSWKHHYVLLILSHSFLFYYLLITKPTGWRRYLPTALMILAIVLHTFTSSFFFGDYWSDVLEAYGVHVIGILFLFAGCGIALNTLQTREDPGQNSSTKKSVPIK